MRFELRQVDSFDDATLLTELRRVDAEVPEGPLTRAAFDAAAKVSSHTLIRRFGGWAQALVAAGIGNRYSGRTVSSRMRTQDARGASDNELIDELKRVNLLSPDGLTRALFDAHARFSSSAIERRFGSWAAGLTRADIEVVPRGRRHSDDDYFENLLAVWTFLGRQPVYREMDVAPSRITGGGYEKKFGTWKKALAAFIARVNAAETRSASSAFPRLASASAKSTRLERPARFPKLSLGLRYEVLRRDRFRCVLCGRSPATNSQLQLHVDHVIHRSRGGDNSLENLRVLCSDCNVGRGVRSDVE